MLNDEILGAYLDGELVPAQRAEVERQLARSNGAKVRLERMRGNDDQLRSAFELGGGNEKDPLAELIVRGWPAQPLSPRLVWGRRAAAIAAACLIGVFAGRLSAPSDAIGPGLGVSREIAMLLDRAPSGVNSPVAGGAMQVALSFRTESGELCRQFRTSARGQSADAIACRDGERWQVSVQAAVDQNAANYRTAGANDPIFAAIEAMGAVVVLDAAEEQALLSSGWRAAQ